MYKMFSGGGGGGLAWALNVEGQKGGTVKL